MKFILNSIMAVILSVTLMTPSMAQVSTRGIDNDLTDAQKISLLQTAQEMRDRATQAKNKVPVTVKEVEAYAKIGENIGRGLSSAAKSMGVAVNDFAKSPVGVMTTIVIVWHFMGSMIVHVVAGTTIFFFGMLLWIYMYRKEFIVPKLMSETYNKDTGKPESKEFVNTSDSRYYGDRRGWFLVMAVVITLVSLVTTFTF